MKNNLPFVLDKKLFVLLFLGCILLYAVESVIHESGHYLAARTVGYQHPIIHYKSTDTGRNALQEEYRAFRKKYASEIAHRKPFAEQPRYALVSEQLERDWEQMKSEKFSRKHTIFAMGGPLATLLIGILGLAALLCSRKQKGLKNSLSPWQWLIVFAALFNISPMIAMFGMAAGKIFHGYPDTSSDIYRVCLHYAISLPAVYAAMGIAGTVAVVATFHAVPARQRFTLLLAIMLGIPLGYLAWNSAGPILLP